MSPRSKKGFCFFSFLIILSPVALCFFSTSAFCSENPAIKFYQEHISAVDGNRCPMHPSCSAYASQAFEKHGPLMGWIMALDRLVRCGRDEAKVAPMKFIGSQSYIHDPVEANDFWWFQKEQTP